MSFFNSDDLFAKYTQETTPQQEDNTVKATEQDTPSEIVESAVTEIATTREVIPPIDKDVTATGEVPTTVEKIDSENVQKGEVLLTVSASDVQVSEIVDKETGDDLLFPTLFNQQETTENPIAKETATIHQETGIADSLFESLSKKAEVAQKAKEEALTKQSPATTKKTASKDTSEEFNVNADTTIRYHREIISILDFFTIEEVENGVEVKKKNETVEYKKIDGELVRERMEKAGFLEFVKGFSQFNYFGKNRNFIVPSTISKKKGNLQIEVTEEVQSHSDSTSFLFQYERKIPFTILGQFIALAKMLGRLKLEVLAEIYFNYDTDEFILHIPKQQVHELWCISKEEPGEFQRKLLEEKGHHVELACEIHSHHELRPIPSSTDNASERKPKMFYVIVGQTDRDIPNVYARTFTTDGTNGYHIEKNINDIFSNDGFNDKSFMTLPHFKASWIDIIR